MTFYNKKNHNRQSIRLKGRDYSKSDLYFITVCCNDRLVRFGEIVDGKMVLNEIGIVAYLQWIKLQDRFLNFELEVFQIMPDHIHAIIALTNPATNVGATLAVARDNQPIARDNQPIARDNKPVTDPGLKGQPQGLPQEELPQQNSTIGSIIGAYKSIVSNEILKIYKSKNEIMGKIWQRNYYEHIIRNHESYINISNYITDNPKRWDEKRRGDPCGRPD